MTTKEWVSIHRKHHAKCETEEDPHSPQTRGIRTVLWTGAELYMKEADNAETLTRYGHGTPSDWVERNVYSRYTWQGLGLMLGVDLVLFGAAGLAIWAVQMMWIPFFAAGVINGLGHWWGYRNFDTPDHSRNLPGRYWSLLTCGEALHNNHHHIQNSPRFAMRRGELDPGYWYFRILQALRLARARQENQAVAA
jgi:stearoyl-CoA desaturase (delta-9 desaturase)